MSDRRNRPPNRFGCKPTEDVCVEHDMPLECRHGCTYVKEHKCKDKEQECTCYESGPSHQPGCPMRKP